MNPTYRSAPTLADVAVLEAVLLEEMRYVSVRVRQAAPIRERDKGLVMFLNDLARDERRNSRPIHRYVLVAPQMAQLVPELAPLIKRPLGMALALIDNAVGHALVDERIAQEHETTLEGAFNAAQMHRQAVQNRATARQCLDALNAYRPSLDVLERVWYDAVSQ